jgi:hypothetical protein
LAKDLDHEYEQCGEGGWDFIVNDAAYAKLPDCGEKDRDFDFAKECAVDDEDVLMLFDMPELANDGPMAKQMRCAHLHPREWFVPFQKDLVMNHI